MKRWANLFRPASKNHFPGVWTDSRARTCRGSLVLRPDLRSFFAKLHDAERVLALRLRARHLHMLALVGFRHILVLNLHDCAFVIDKHRISALFGAAGVAGTEAVHLCNALRVAD